MREAITVKNLTKAFGQQTAVNDISFELKAGEVFGFLGPNGAGKTTTIKLLCGMNDATAGEMSVFGLDPAKKPEAIHEIAGVMTEHAQMYNQLTGLENLVYFGELFGLTKKEAVLRAAALLEQLNLTEAKDKPLSNYSTGMRQRLSLARALIHQPKLLFLDEPTSGLDPESAKSVNELITRLAEEGTTIFLCTHQLRYAQEVCTSYGLINKGHLFATGTLDGLREQVFSGFKLQIKSSLKPKGVMMTLVAENTYEGKVQSEDDVAAMVEGIIKDGGRVYQVRTEQLNLEELYFELMKGVKGHDQ